MKYTLFTYLIIILFIIFTISFINFILPSQDEPMLEGYGGRTGRRWYGGHKGHHWHGGHSGRRWYNWSYPVILNYIGNICKNGCVSLGNGEWGCQYPGYGINDCQFADDCYNCGGYLY